MKCSTSRMCYPYCSHFLFTKHLSSPLGQDVNLLGKNTYGLLTTSLESSEEGGIILGRMDGEEHRELRCGLFGFIFRLFS